MIEGLHLTLVAVQTKQENMAHMMRERALGTAYSGLKTILPLLGTLSLPF